MTNKELKKLVSDLRTEITHLDTQIAELTSRKENSHALLVLLEQRVGASSAADQPLRGVSLKEAMKRVLTRAGGALTPPQITEKILELGYQTKSKSPRTLVYQGLSRYDDFKSNGSGGWVLA